MRNLLIFLLVLFGIWWVRRALSGAKRGRDNASSAHQAEGENRSVEHMVECAHCGVHVPEMEGVRDGARFYCSETHRLAGPANRD